MEYKDFLYLCKTLQLPGSTLEEIDESGKRIELTFDSSRFDSTLWRSTQEDDDNPEFIGKELVLEIAHYHFLLAKDMIDHITAYDHEKGLYSVMIQLK